MENPPVINPPSVGLEQHAERLRASGVLGRSDLIRRLFDYLVTCATAGRVPKEIEVAIDGFGRPADFDVSQDAMVRVYVHKLRRKLEDFYARPGGSVDGSLRIPRGEYRLVLDPPEAGESAPVVVAEPEELEVEAAVIPPPAARGWTRRERWGGVAIAFLLVLCGVLAYDAWEAPAGDPATRTLRANALWAPLLEDELPIQIVLGDYYIFGEREGGEGIARLVRDFDINSRADLEHRLKQDPQLASRYADLNLGYLPTSSAQALRAILPILTGTGKAVNITLASELPPSAFKNSHVVYIGYLSGLGMMQDVVFAGSRFAIGSSYDELIDTVDGTQYVSEAGAPLPETERYRDYAYLSTFGGPEGNQHLILAGTRDTAVMQTAEIAASPRRCDELLARSARNRSFEALYEVYGVSGTNLEARLLLTQALDSKAIWGEPTDVDSVAGLAQSTARR
ncbi:MAG: hypothetical protein ABW136_00505 [Steroidobacteraceae bacterium]